MTTLSSPSEQLLMWRTRVTCTHTHTQGNKTVNIKYPPQIPRAETNTPRVDQQSPEGRSCILSDILWITTNLLVLVHLIALYTQNYLTATTTTTTTTTCYTNWWYIRTTNSLAMNTGWLQILLTTLHRDLHHTTHSVLPSNNQWVHMCSSPVPINTNTRAALHCLVDTSVC